MRNIRLALAFSAVLARTAFAQGPIFLPPPNTTPVHNMSPGLTFFRKGAQTDLVFQSSYGLLPNLTVGAGTTMIMDGGGPMKMARLQAQVKLRLLQKTGEGSRTVFGIAGGVAVPLGEAVSLVARTKAVSRIATSATLSHVNRRTGYFVSTILSSDAHDGGDRGTATVGIAASWRFKPAPPGATGGPGVTLFAESLVHHETNNSGWVAVAPGLLYRFGRTQVKFGARIPVRRWNSTSRLMLTIGSSLFIPM